MSALEILQTHALELAEATGLAVRVIPDGDRNFVLIEKAPIPPGVARVERADLLFHADHQYPYSAMDMFWTEPEVVRVDGSVHQAAEAIEPYLGRSWRRFSWHRNGRWNPARNGVMDHYAFVESRWTAEVRR